MWTLSENFAPMSKSRSVDDPFLEGGSFFSPMCIIARYSGMEPSRMTD
jgi:hypothetical protein